MRLSTQVTFSATVRLKVSISEMAEKSGWILETLKLIQEGMSVPCDYKDESLIENLLL